MNITTENAVETLRMIKEDSGQCDTELARGVGVPARSLSDWIRGQYKPTADNAAKVVKYCQQYLKAKEAKPKKPAAKPAPKKPAAKPAPKVEQAANVQKYDDIYRDAVLETMGKLFQSLALIGKALSTPQGRQAIIEATK